MSPIRDVTYVKRRDGTRGSRHLPDRADQMSDRLHKAVRRTAWHEGGVLAPLSVGWRHRELILAVLRRELADRFSGSAFGWVWAVVGPLITLGIYTVTLTKAMQLPLATAHGNTSSYALSTFVGLIVFGLFAELCSRAPLLMHEHAWFLKTSIFPSETLAWTAVLRALSYAGISFLVLLVFELALNGIPPLSILLLPFIVAPLVMFLLGMVWFLAAIGAFTRDMSYLMITFIPLACSIGSRTFPTRCARSPMPTRSGWQSRWCVLLCSTGSCRRPWLVVDFSLCRSRFAVAGMPYSRATRAS
jgi:lipopolysaccharide transport system permease protein